jgi:large repetitive protein
MAATPSGKGYWMVAGDGGIFSFGDASFYGSAVDGGAEKRIVDIAPSATGKGYYITASNGAVYAYGDAKSYGGAEGQKLAHGIISMVPINNGEPPLASNDAITIDEDGTADIDVLANDRDPDGGVLSVVSVAPPLHGTATVTDGRITYHPTFNYSGNDTFSYTVIDSNGQTAVGLVSVTVRALDDLPRAVDDAKTVMIGQTITIDVLGNDGGLGDGLLDLSILPPQPTRGTVAKSADGRAIVYTPTRRGSDTIRYRIVDTDGDNAEAVVKITVEGASPKAVDIGPVDCSAGACTVDVLASGASLGNNGQLTLVGESGGAKTVDGVGTFRRQGTVISFTAAKGSVGTVEISCQSADDTETSTAQVKFRYHNGAPIADGGSDALPANTQKHYQLTGHDPDGDPVVFLFDSASGPVDPTPFFQNRNPDGSFDFAGGPAGVWEIRFRVFDGSEASSQVTFTITTT